MPIRKATIAAKVETTERRETLLTPDELTTLFKKGSISEKLEAMHRLAAAARRRETFCSTPWCTIPARFAKPPP